MFLTRWTSPPPQTGRENVLEFRYPVLRNTKTGIRLARVQPGDGGKTIAIDLIESFVTGTSRPQYDALSYTWGDGGREKTIFCNGKRLAVTRTLWEALSRLRDKSKIVTLWIDQICICQERILERNATVEMMGEIFKTARRVIVWLGEDYDRSKAGMRLARTLLPIAKHQRASSLSLADLEAHNLSNPRHTDWRALTSILTRPWFWRTWIVQEVVLNGDVELMLGEATISWTEMEAIVALLEGPLPRVWNLDQAISTLELPFSRINRIRQRHRRAIDTTDETTQASNQNPGESAASADDTPELLDLLLVSRDLGATDPRDKIYALLGLGKHDIIPDYSMSPESVFTDFALQTIGLVTHLAERRAAADLSVDSSDREVRQAMILLSCAGRQNQRLSIPSWCPDWTQNLQSRPFIFGIGQRYCAGGSRLDVFDWQPDTGLQICGRLLDTMDAVGTVNLTGADPQNLTASHKNIARWWQEAQALAYSRVVRSPGSTAYTDAFEAMRRRLSLCKHGYYVGAEAHEGRLGRRESLLEQTDVTTDPRHNALRTLTLGPTRGRVPFVSASGWVGLVPWGTKEGDVIFVFVGADVPFVCRNYGDQYEIIGEAYVQGIMEGEAMGMDWLGMQDVMIR